MFHQPISEAGTITYQLASLGCLLFMLPILCKCRTTFGSQIQTRLFLTTIGCFLLFIVTDVIMLYYREVNPGIPIWFCEVNTSVNEIALTFVGFFWFLFCAARLNIRRFDSVSFKVLASIPMIIEMLLSVSSPLTGLFFTIQNGVYHRGPLYLIQAGAVMSYLILTSVAAMIQAARATSKAEKVKDLSLIKFILPPAVAGTVQIIGHNTPFMTIGIALAIYMVFIDMLDLQVNNDALTGLNNRRRADYYLTDCVNEADKKPFCIYMIDVDRFKEINDQYGHGEGDKALCIVASALKKTAEKYKGFAARTGGDEFVLSIFYENGTVIEDISGTVNQYIDDKCREENVPYSLNVSVGYKLVMDKSEQISEILKNADRMLYQNKREHHRISESK